jgi:hypothetical protein
MPFDLSSYATVEERLALFWAANPNGRIQTEIVGGDITNWICFKTSVYRDMADAVPVATGFAFEERTERGVNQASWCENAETSSTGRALANWVYAAGKRPSREEMQKVERMGGQPAPTGASDAAATPAQVKMLRALRYPGDPTSLTKRQASVEIDKLRQAPENDAF